MDGCDVRLVDSAKNERSRTDEQVDAQTKSFLRFITRDCEEKAQAFSPHGDRGRENVCVPAWKRCRSLRLAPTRMLGRSW